MCICEVAASVAGGIGAIWLAGRTAQVVYDILRRKKYGNSTGDFKG